MADPRNPRERVEDFSPRRLTIQSTIRPSFQFTPVAGGVSRETEELVKSLSGLSTKLNETFAPILKEQRQSAAQEGAQAASTNQLKFAEAIEKGVIPETASPWFIKGWQHQEGRVEGLRYQIEQQTAWTKSDVRNTDDTDKLLGFQRGFRQQYAERIGGGASSDFLQGFHAVADVADAQLANQHIRYKQEEISNRVRENTGTEISAILAKNAGNADAAAEEINLLGKRMMADGLSPTDFRKAVAEQTIATAKLTGNPRHADVLDRVKLENGQPLSSDATVRAARADLEHFLTQKARSAQEWAWRVEDRGWTLQQRKRAEETNRREDEAYLRNRDRWSREDFTRGALSAGVAAVFANPEDYRNAAAPYLKELADRDPEAAKSFATWIESFGTSQRSVDDREESARLRWEMINAAGDPARQSQIMQEAFALSVRGKLNQSSLSNIVDDAGRWRTSRSDLLIQSDQVRVIFAAVDKIAQQDPQGLYGSAATNALLGRRMLQNEAMAFISANPSATPDQLAAHLSGKLPSIVPLLSQQAAEKGTDAGSVRKEARQAHGSPEPTLIQRADAMATAPATRILIAAVANARTDEEVAQILAHFDERTGTPGLARTIIHREAARSRQKPKGTR